LEIKQVDNFFPALQQKQIIQKIFDNHTQWFYYPAVSYDKTKNRDIINKWGKNNNFYDSEGFFYPLDVNDKQNKSFVDSVAYAIKTKFDTTVNEILRLQFSYLPPNPLIESNSCLYPHIDREIPHKTILYYLFDSDADTFFFNQYFEKEFDYNTQSVLTRITPKKGSAVLFDGFMFHAASVSKTKKRVTLNINFT